MNSEPPDKHRSIKQSLKNVVRDPASQRAILDVVHASHRITVHALQFLKLYLLACFESDAKLPVVTEHLVVSIMNVLCEESEQKTSKRDRNGSLNIMRCAQKARMGEPRPSYMARTSVRLSGLSNRGLPTTPVFDTT